MKKNLHLILLSLSLILLLFMVGATFYVTYKNFHRDIQYIYVDEKESTPKKEDEIYKLSFVAAGDALIHNSVYADAYNKLSKTYDFKYQLELIKPIISKYDLAFYNQETIFAGAELGYSHFPRFNTPSEFGDAMIDAGFNIVALANNHSYDKGEVGVLNAVKYFEEQNVLWNGMNNSFEMQDDIKIMEKNNITYALISYTTLNNGLNTPKGKEYLVNYYSDERAKRDIESIRNKVDVIIVSIHWGVEYTHKPNANQIKIANYLSELGVNIICGHHPHVLQPIDKIGNTVVMYSLGNVISSQIGVERLTGVLVSLNITKKNGVISIDTPEAELIYTYRSEPYYIDFKLIPYSQLDEKHLKNYGDWFEKQKKIITEYDNNILVR